MKRLVLLACLALLAAPVVAAEDFTGKWSGSFVAIRPDGSLDEDKIFLDLKHKGKELTGTAGPSAERQWPVLKGVVDGNKVTFEVQAGETGPLLKFALVFADGRLKGEANGEEGGQKRTAKIDAGREKAK